MLILKNFSKFFSFLVQIMAFLTIIILGLVYLNDALPFPFINAEFLATLKNIKEYAVILTITVCGLSFACKRSILIFIPFCILAVCALACSWSKDSELCSAKLPSFCWASARFHLHATELFTNSFCFWQAISIPWLYIWIKNSIFKKWRRQQNRYAYVEQFNFLSVKDFCTMFLAYRYPAFCVCSYNFILQVLFHHLDSKLLR